MDVFKIWISCNFHILCFYELILDAEIKIDLVVGVITVSLFFFVDLSSKISDKHSKDMEKWHKRAGLLLLWLYVENFFFSLGKELIIQLIHKKIEI